METTMRARRRPTNATNHRDIKDPDSEEITRPRRRTRPLSHANQGDITPDDVPQLHTPGEAAEILTVKESWLRRKASQRLIPCTFIGKHLRFSTADLQQITEAGHQHQRVNARRRR
jgi:excisionase family DNA binding protein